MSTEKPRVIVLGGKILLSVFFLRNTLSIHVDLQVFAASASELGQKKQLELALWKVLSFLISYRLFILFRLSPNKSSSVGRYCKF